MQKLFLVFTLIATTPLFASEKSRDWQTGKLADMSQDSTFTGMTNPGQGGISTAIHDVEETYIIDDGTMIYTVTERLKWRWSKEADLVVNRPVKFSVDEKS